MQLIIKAEDILSGDSMFFWEERSILVIEEATHSTNPLNRMLEVRVKARLGSVEKFHGNSLVTVYRN